MSWNPNQGQSPDPQSQGQYGGYSGYSGYTPPSQPQQPQPDPYANQQQGGYYGGQQQQQQQQQYTYQPPPSVAAAKARTSSASDPTTLGMDAKTEGLLSYFLFFISGIIFFLLERKNRFVRFHAAQSTVFFVGVGVLLTVFRLLALIPLLGFVLGPLAACATWVITIPAALIWVFMMVQAYRGVYVKLPIVGDYAEALVQRFSKKPRTV